MQMLRNFLYFLSSLLGPFATRQSFPLGAEFSFVWRQISEGYASKYKRNYRSAWKIPISEKQQQFLLKSPSLYWLVFKQRKIQPRVVNST